MHLVEPRTFRATREAWLAQLLLPLVFFGLLIHTAVRSGGLSPITGALGMAVLVLFAGWDYLLPMLRNWLRVDERMLEGSLDGRAFHVYWTEILAAWVFRRGRRRFLCLGTHRRTYIVPLRYFDAIAVWEAVVRGAPAEALARDAIQRLPDYQEWQAARTEPVAGDATRAFFDHWLIQVIGWAGMAFFTAGFAWALPDRAVLPAALFAALAGISLATVLNWGFTEFSEQGIERLSLFRSAGMTWEQVRRIEVDPFEAVIVLVGDDCQVVIPGPAVWAGGRQLRGLAVLLDFAARYNVPVQRTTLALTRRTRKNSARR